MVLQMALVWLSQGFPRKTTVHIEVSEMLRNNTRYGSAGRKFLLYTGQFCCLKSETSVTNIN